MNYKTLKISLFLTAALFVSCHRFMPQQEQEIVAEVSGNFLYLDELQLMIPSALHAADSADFAERFIRKWITDILMYERARQNISDMSEIDRLVNEYRKSLIIHHYQQRLLEQNQLRVPTEIEIMEFYETYRNRMIMRENMLQGLLLVVPIDAPNIADVRRWLLTADEESIQKIERYSLQNAISYDYFMDRWIPLTMVTRRTPFEVQVPAQFLAASPLVEMSSSAQHYFLRISSFLTIGQEKPYELAREKIINILSARNSVEFISELENQLFNRAVSDGTAIIRN